MTLKQKIYNHYQNLVEEKIKILRNMITDLAEDAQSDAKGSAGDKHETALAMMHLEQEKLNHKLKEVLEQKTILDGIDGTANHTKVSLGSLVFTNTYIFFISSALLKIKIDDSEIIALSPQSPLGEVMKGKTKSDIFSFNKMHYEILAVQ